MPDFSTPAEHIFSNENQVSDPDSGLASAIDTSLSLEQRYEIDWTVEEILQNGYQTIALQFPDELLGESVRVYRALMDGLRRGANGGQRRRYGEEGAGPQCFVLGDSTYGSCCPDVLSSLHLPADFLVHYGHACLTPTSALPVRYVFPKLALNVEEAAESLWTSAFPANAEKEANQSGEKLHDAKDNVAVVWDVGYDWAASDIAKALESSKRRPANVRLIVSRIDKSVASGAGPSRPRREFPAKPSDSATEGVEPARLPSDSESEEEEEGENGLDDIGGAQVGVPEGFTSRANAAAVDSDPLAGGPTTRDIPSSLRIYPLPSGVNLWDCTIFYIGEESRSLVNLMMENANCQVYQYRPSTSETHLASSRTPLLLSRRLFALHRAYAASTFGILVHNVGLSRSHSVVREIRDLLKSHGKKSYTVSVGRLNPAKLANFEVVECWVLVGCLEGGLVDPKEYYRPIITPWELTLALQGERATWAPERWTLDFEKVMREMDALTLSEDHDKRENEGDDDDKDNDRDAPVFSLASGQYHSQRHFDPIRSAEFNDNEAVEDGKQDGSSSSALVRTNASGQLVKKQGLANVAGNYLASRSWKGLDPTEGTQGDQQHASELVQGRTGVARGYQEEKRE